MTRRKKHIEIIREGDYLAEVDVELIVREGGWSPTFSVDDAYKLDDVRAALRRGDLSAAARHSRVFRVLPVAV